MRIGILTVSDGCARGQREDRSGSLIAEWCVTHEYQVVVREVVPDETPTIIRVLISWVDQFDLDLVVTTGGTGLTMRDVTPEATRAVLDREAPGIAEEIRRVGRESTRFSALFHRLLVYISSYKTAGKVAGCPKCLFEQERLIP